MAQTNTPHRFTLYVRALLIGFIWVSYACMADTNATFHVDIPSQKLTESVIQLGKLSNISIVAPSKLLQGFQSPAMKGRYSATEALTILLQNSSLTFTTINQNVIVIRAKETTKSAPSSNRYISESEELLIVGKQITGSFLTRTDLQGSSPVDIINEREFDISGSQSVADFLKFLPAVSGNSTSTAISNGGNGIATITLRGLPASNTLVLINGRRIATEGLEGSSVDLNSIPSAAIERVEILKDGASAIYGTDAIAGVVNVIMKREYDGLQIEQYIASSYKNDLETYATHMLWGTVFDEGSALVSLQNFDQNGIFSRDRSVSANADGRALGGIDKRSTAIPDSRIALQNDMSVTALPNALGVSEDNYRPATNEDRFNYFSQSSSISPSNRQNLYFSGSYHLSDSITTNIDGGINKTEATITLASVPIFTAFETTPIIVSADNIYNPFGYDITDVRRRVLELEPREQKNTTTAKRLNFTIDGYRDNSEWQLSANWNTTKATEVSSNLLNETLVARALGPSESCQGIALDGCEPMNILGPSGSISQSQLAYLSTSRKIEGTAELYGINGMLSASTIELPYGPLQAAFGFDFRKEKVNSRTTVLAQDNAIGDVSRDPTRGERSVYEGFIESLIPLLKDIPGVHSLGLELAVRHSKHDDFGKNTSPKLGLRYRPLPELLFRSTYSDGFRAPNLGEQYAGGYQVQLPLTDPCSLPDQSSQLPGCSQQSDESRIQYLTTFFGQPDLKPETSKSYTFGFVWTPVRFADLYISIDKFDIKQKDIVTANAQLILNRNAQFNEFQDLVMRDEQGDITEIFAPFINVGEREVSGVDTTLKYRFKSKEFGRFSYSLNAAYLEKYAWRLDALSPLIDIAGTFEDAANEGNGALPQWKANMGISWSLKRLDVNYSVNYISDVVEQIPRSESTRDLGSWLTHDIQLSVELSKRFTFTLGADNLWNNKPPFAASAFNDNYDARTYDIRGQFVYGRLVFSAF